MTSWRRWHRWIATISGILLLLVAVTGILLQIDEIGHLSEPPPEPKVDVALLAPIDPSAATGAAVAQLGETHEGSEIVSLKVESTPDGPIAVAQFKDKIPGVRINLTTGEQTRPYTPPPARYALIKRIRLFVLNVHTFGIVGAWGHIVGAIVSCLMVFLAGSGLWMWFVMARERFKRSKSAWFWR